MGAVRPLVRLPVEAVRVGTDLARDGPCIFTHSREKERRKMESNESLRDVEKDLRPQYGPARANFRTIAELQAAYRGGAEGRRPLGDMIATGIYVEDNYDDIIGYARLAKQLGRFA